MDIRIALALTNVVMKFSAFTDCLAFSGSEFRRRVLAAIATTALPMIAIMVMNGMLGIVDVIFLGHFVGAEAMAAVGMAFPVLMLTIALTTATQPTRPLPVRMDCLWGSLRY